MASRFQIIISPGSYWIWPPTDDVGCPPTLFLVFYSGWSCQEGNQWVPQVLNNQSGSKLDLFADHADQQTGNGCKKKPICEQTCLRSSNINLSMCKNPNHSTLASNFTHFTQFTKDILKHAVDIVSKAKRYQSIFHSVCSHSSSWDFCGRIYVALRETDSPSLRTFTKRH